MNHIMPRYPHTKLFSDHRRVVVLSGPHIQVIDAQTGCVLYSTANDAGVDVLAGGPIRCSGMSTDGRYLATTGDDKRLKIWDLGSFTLSSFRELPKKPTSIAFTSNKDILVSDKFGDVFRYTLHPKDELQEGKGASDKFASHENPSSGELILGHASLLTSCLLTPDEKYLITADRDEHIRVSWYPEGYIIERYCLGHKKYVSAIHIPLVSPSSLISGGGDPELKIWDWMTGRLQQNIPVYAAVEPFIKITTEDKPRRAASMGSDDSDFQGPSKGANKTSNSTATVLVIRSISSFVSDGEIHVVFSVVGGTAVFEFILAETGAEPDIRHHDFEKPIIDFTLCDEGLIWVLLDADFPNKSDDPPRDLVHVIQWSVDQFVEVGNSVLLDTLNTICAIPASAEDLKALDLYSDLTSLPKSIDGEQASRGSERTKPRHEPPEDESVGEGTLTPVGPTKRALGRLKHKRALDQLHHEKANISRDSSGPETKKTKADSDDEESREDAVV